MRQRTPRGDRTRVLKRGSLLAALAAAGLLAAASAAADPLGYRAEVLADNPASYWRLGELGGLVMADETGANPGAFGAGTLLNQSGALESDPDRAASFDGIDDYATVPDSSSLDLAAAVTVEVWVKRRVVSGAYEVVVGKPGNFTARLENYALWLTTSNRFRAYFGNGGYSFSVQTAVVTNTVWHHVVATYGGGRASIYLDGALQESKTSSLVLTPNANPLNIGRANSNAYLFNGVLDEVAIYPVVLPAARVLAHFQAASASAPAPVGDVTPPTVALSAPASGSVTNDPTPIFAGAAGTASGDSGTVTVKVYSGASVGGTAAQTLTATRQADGSYSTTVSLAEGTWTARAEQTDSAGNTGFSSANTFVVDVTAPTVTITAGPSKPTRDPSASFTFSAGETGGSLDCSLDGADFTACSSPRGYEGLRDGPHSFAVRATDTAGNTSALAGWAWTVDTAAPETEISAGPEPLTKEAAATFAFTSEAGAAFACSLDGGEFGACSGPQSYEGLADGSHTFSVRATDAAGNTGAAVTRDWTVDTAAPAARIDAGPAALTNETNASFAFSSEPGAAFSCSLGGGEFGPCTGAQDYVALADGSHTFAVRATDLAGNIGAAAGWAWTIDTVAPETELESGPPALTNQTSASFAFSSDAGASLECSLDSGEFASCTSVQDYVALADGSHTFAVRATDAAGNTGASLTHRWVVDTVAPAVPSIGSAPPDPSAGSSGSIEFAGSEEGIEFLCSLDGGDFAACTSPQDLAGLTDGVHGFRVRARDGAGNESGVSTHIWRVDTTGPTTTITSRPTSPTRLRAATLAFSVDEAGATSECRLDGAPFASCTSPQSYVELAAGSHTFAVRSADELGNQGATALYTWEIDTTPPPEPQITLAPSDPTRQAQARFEFHDDEPGATLTCSLDGATAAACAAAVEYVGLIEARHRFEIRARDAAGNESTERHVWRVSFRPPPPTIGARPPGLTTSTAATFGFSDAEIGVSFECSLDGGAYVPCTSPQSYAELADGSHSFRVSAVDGTGAASLERSAGWTIDTAPPAAPSTTGGPPDPSGSSDASFSFTGPDATPAPPGEALPPPLPSSTGTAFYVAPTGLDSNPGTEAAPWRTIQKALNVLQPGQRALVREGTYAENLDFRRAGTAAAPITIENYPGERPVVTGAGSHPLEVSTTGSYLRVRGFVLERSPSLGGGNIDVYGHHVEIAGNEIRLGTDQGIYLDEPSHHVQILGNWIHDNGQGLIHQSHGIYLQGEDHLVANNLIHDHPFGFGIQVYDETRRAVITHNTIARSGLSGIVLGGFPGVEDIQVLNNVFALNHRYGISVDSYPPSLSRAEHNVLFANGDGPVQPDATGIHFAANLTSDPFFGDPGSDGFRPRIGSPARGQALSTYSPAFDLDGNARSLGDAPDIGAFESPAGFECSLDGGSFTPCTSPQGYPGLADGPHAFVLRIADDAGHASPAPSLDWTIETRPPTTSITAGPGDPSNEPAPTFTFAADEPVVGFECSLGGAPFTPCASPQDSERLADGAHTFAVRATDLAGKTGVPASWSWTIETVPPPLPSIDSAPPDPAVSAGASFAFSSNESGVTFRCSLDEAPFATCASAQGYSGLADGLHGFRLRTRDAAGNESGDVSYTWRVDTTGPTTTLGARPGNPSNLTTATFSFSASEAGSSFACRLDAGSFVACSSAQTYAELGEGGHTFTVRATDALGNAGTAVSYTWTINTAGPSVRSAAASTANSALSLTVARPPETAAGDLLLAIIGHQGGTARSLTAPAGWTAVPNGDYAQGTNARIHAWYRPADAFEPFSYTFTLTGGSGQDISGGILAVAGASTEAPINDSLGQVNATSSRSVVAPSIAPSVGNALLVYGAATSLAGTFTPPAGMTEQFDGATSGTYRVTTETAVQVLPASGPTGTRTAQLSSSGRSVTLSIALAPR